MLGLGPAADAPLELHAVLRAYGGMAEAATREWLERDRWSREQVAAFLKAALPELVGAAYEAIPKQSSNQTRRTTMSKRTFVIGVGMTKFDKPGSKEGDYPDWAKEAGEQGARRRRHPLRGRRAGLRGLLLRRLDLRASARSTGSD